LDSPLAGGRKLPGMFTIGEFSKATGLTVKTLRFYHEQGVLVPAYVDPDTGYRYYRAEQIETARIIVRLRELELPLERIAEILREYDDEGDLLEFLEQHRLTIAERLKQVKAVLASLDEIISREREARTTMTNASFEVEEKQVPPMLIAGVRMRGRYSDCGQGFARIGRRFGRHICGKPLLLHYDHEYREDDADFEACMPVRKGSDVDGISVRELPGGRCVSLVYRGPWDELGRSYAKILGYVKDRGYEIECPTREIYLNGPGMIFRGNPKKYLTEIQMLVRG
ncbi:MAG TPA: MerR family transcriptional regulator, partial [Planctomycetaceae bacterium]|nr:MerR family transcriptional regulator [Planctomycetaceae bacterium]